MGLPALDLFSREKWARVRGRRLRTQTRFDLALGDVCGEAILRQAIVDYLRVSRSIECLPEQVFITSGYADSMRLLLRTLSVPGDSMWGEDPGFPLIRPVITQEGITLSSIPVDADGLNVAAGMWDCPQGALCIGDARPSNSTGDTVAVSPNGATLDCGNNAGQIKYVAIRQRTSLATQAKQRPDKNPYRCGGSYATPGFFTHKRIRAPHRITSGLFYASTAMHPRSGLF